MEREIILDTETTGLDPKDGHRLVELGCIEVVNRLPTGKFFHKYLNPLREIGYDATRIHGITNEMVKDSPKFEEIADEFLEFIGDSRLVIHNADFDIKFINAELFYAKKPDISFNRVFCTLKYARKKFPGAQNSLDALCKRFNVNNSHREKHGALLDSEILAEVYLELMGGRQTAIELNADENISKEHNNNFSDSSASKKTKKTNLRKADFSHRLFDLTDDEKNSHKKFSGTMKDSMWGKVYNS